MSGKNEVTKKRPGGRTKENLKRKAQYYPQLKELIERVGTWNVNFEELSRDWNIPKTTIHRWKDIILKEIDAIKPEEYGRELTQAVKASIRQCILIINDPKTKKAERALFMDKLDKLSKTLTELLERYGKKQRVAEKKEIRVEGDVTFQEVRTYFKHLRSSEYVVQGAPSDSERALPVPDEVHRASGAEPVSDSEQE